MKNQIKSYISESIAVKENILKNEELLNLVEKAVIMIVKAYKEGNKVLIAGNGGSAADSQHMATELVSKFLKDRPPLNAIALTTNTSILTSIGNDFGYEYIFSRQIQAYGYKNDIYIAISTSGNSENIIKSIEEAKKRGLKVIGLTGAKSCLMDKICDLTIKIPSEKTPIIQEAHLVLEHLICMLVEFNMN